jgi:hypothetical protein
MACGVMILTGTVVRAGIVTTTDKTAHLRFCVATEGGASSGLYFATTNPSLPAYWRDTLTHYTQT